MARKILWRDQILFAHWTILLLTILYFTLVTAVFNAPEDRYRLPIDPILFMFAASGVVIIWQGALSRWRTRRCLIRRISAVRSFLLNHLYHHRGQLTVYLRLLDIPLPSTYGPTADKNPFANM